MVILSEKDKRELEKIHQSEEFWQTQDVFKRLEITPFEDEEKLKFHTYMKELAQSLLGDTVDLDAENLVFFLSDDKNPNAAFMHYDDDDRKCIYVSAGLLNACANKDQFAFVLGHELQHFLEHKAHGQHRNSKAEEGYADLNAIPKMAQAGLNIEQAKVITDKLMSGKEISNLDMLDEHISDPNRRTLLDMRITAERNRLLSLGLASPDVTGDKTHPFEDDFKTLIESRPKAQSLRRFFDSKTYTNASYEERIDMWFTQIESRLKIREGKDGAHFYQEFDALDKKIIQEEFQKILQSSHKDNGYYLQKKYLDVLFAEKRADLAYSKGAMLYELMGDTSLAFPTMRFANLVQEKIGNLREIKDKEQLDCTFEKMYWLWQTMQPWHRNVIFSGKLFGLSHNDDDIGTPFSKMLLDKISESPCFEMQEVRDDLVLKDGTMYLLFDKKGNIQAEEMHISDLQLRLLASQINETVRILHAVRRGENIDSNLKIQTLERAWQMLSSDITHVSEYTGERLISIGYNGKGFETYERCKDLSNGTLEEYLTPEAKEFWKEGYTTGTPKKYSDFITDTFLENIEELPETEFSNFNYMLVDATFEDIESRLEAYEKLTKAYIKRRNEICSPRIVEKIAAIRLCQHLKSGGHLDDFEFPFKKEYQDHCRKLKDNKQYQRLFAYEMRPFYTYEMLQKNPDVDLSQVHIESSQEDTKTQRTTCALGVISLEDTKEYMQDRLGESLFHEIEMRLHTNKNDPANWGNGTTVEGLSDLDFKERFEKIIDRALAPDKLQDIALHFYQNASVDDKIDWYSKALMQTVDKYASTEENTAAKEKIWQVIKIDFDNKDISLEKRLQLFLTADKNDLFSEDKIAYFQTLAGIDGNGGLLKEIENAPEPKTHLYMALLAKENRIPDPDIRAKVISLAAKQFHKENGSYNDITQSLKKREAFIAEFKHFKPFLDNMLEIDKHPFLRELAEITLAQEDLCHAIKPDPSKIDTQDGTLIAAAYGLDGLTYLMQKNIISRESVLDYLLGDGSPQETKDIADKTRSKLSLFIKKDGGKGYEPMLNKINPQYFHRIKQEFDSASLEVKGAIINLLGEDNDWERHFYSVSDKLFKDAGDLADVGKKFLKSYISSRQPSERCFYLSAMWAAANNNDTSHFDDKQSPYTREQRALAQGFRLFLENSGPAGVKLAQAMSSYSGVPDFIRDEMQKAKSSANPPARWEIFEWLESAGEKEVLEYGKIGKLLGSASFFVTYDMYGVDGKDKVVKIMRRGSKGMADAEFKIYKEMLSKMKDHFEGIESFDRLVQNAADMVDVETNLDIGEKQLKDAQLLYPENVTADGIEFKLKVADWDARGATWAQMDKAKGLDFAKLEQPYKTSVAKAVFTTELSNMLSGKRFDSDRHAGQYKIDPTTNTIGIFDTGSMSVIEPTEKEKRVLGIVLAQTVKKLYSASNQDLGTVLCAEIDKGIATYYQNEIKEGKPIPPYLSEFQRGLLALTDFHKEIPSKDLAVCLMQSLNNNKQKLDKEIYKGFVIEIKDFAAKVINEKSATALKSTQLHTLQAVNEVLFDKRALTGDSAIAQELGKTSAKQLLKTDNLYDALTTLPDSIKDTKIIDLLHSKTGQIHFKKGIMKGVFESLNPKNYSQADKKQMGELCFHVIEKMSKNKRLHKDVSVVHVFNETIAKTPELGMYAKNLKSVLQIADKLHINADLEAVQKAVILSRIADKDVQKGYMQALRQSSEKNILEQSLSRINPISFIPRKATRKVAKFILKDIAPKILEQAERKQARKELKPNMMKRCESTY